MEKKVDAEWDEGVKRAIESIKARGIKSSPIEIAAELYYTSQHFEFAMHRPDLVNRQEREKILRRWKRAAHKYHEFVEP